MKKVSLFFILILFAISCSKENPVDPSQNSNLDKSNYGDLSKTFEIYQNTQIYGHLSLYANPYGGGDLSISGDLSVLGSYNLKMKDMPQNLLDKLSLLEHKIDSLEQKLKEH